MRERDENLCTLLAGRVGRGVIVWETHSRREDNIRVHLIESEHDHIGWIRVARNRTVRRALVTPTFKVPVNQRVCQYVDIHNAYTTCEMFPCNRAVAFFVSVYHSSTFITNVSKGHIILSAYGVVSFIECVITNCTVECKGEYSFGNLCCPFPSFVAPIISENVIFFAQSIKSNVLF